jgi:hypothetical protein
MSRFSRMTFTYFWAKDESGILPPNKEWNVFVSLNKMKWNEMKWVPRIKKGFLQLRKKNFNCCLLYPRTFRGRKRERNHFDPSNSTEDECTFCRFFLWFWIRKIKEFHIKGFESILTSFGRQQNVRT